MNERRLHPFTVLRFLRKTLVVYLLPLVQVLFERNWTACTRLCGRMHCCSFCSAP